MVTIEGITEYRLDNGLKVVLYPDLSKPTATVCMTYLVGSRQENYGETGMAHLLEHLMFKGSTNYPNPTAEFTNRGFQMNGSTWLDRTNYFLSFVSNESNMKFALGWHADAMVNSFIARKDLDSEMTVVRNEYEMGENSPMSVLMKRMQSVMFDWHSYGRNTIGARSDIECVEIENLQNFYRRYYQPDNAVLAVTGHFDVDQVLEWVSEAFGPIPKPARALPHEWTVEPTADGERTFTVRRPGEMQMVMVGYRIPAALHPDYEPVAMATQILGDSPTGRLYKVLVETGMASQVFGYSIAARDPGFVIFGAVVQKDTDMAPVKAVLLDTIQNAFAREPVTEVELKRQKVDQATMFDRQLADAENFGVSLSDYIALGDWRLFFADREMIKAVTGEQINAAAAKYFVRDNAVIGEYIPTTDTQRAEITAAPSPEDVLAQYTFEAEGRSVEAFDPSQANIDAKTTRMSVGGVELALLPKASMGDTVVVQMKFLNGNKTTGANAALGMLMTAMLNRGTTHLTRDQIDDAFTDLKMEGSPFKFTTDREHLTDALALVGDIMCNPSFPAAEFDTLKQQTLVALQAKTDDPMVLGRDALTRHFNTYEAGDSRHTETSAELIEGVKALTLDAVREHWKTVFGTQKGLIAAVGDFDKDEFVAALKRFVIDQKTPTVPFERAVSDYKPVSAVRVALDAPEKENAALFARVDFAGNQSDKDAAALYIADWIVGGSNGLSNRIMDRLRQKEGLSYGASSTLRLPLFGDRAQWSCGAIVAPQNLKQAEDSLRDLLATAVKDGLTADELEKAKQGMLEYRTVNRSKDTVLAGGWLNMMEGGHTWAFSAELDDEIRALTLDDVNAALRRFADPDKLTFVLVGDMAKAREAGKAFA